MLRTFIFILCIGFINAQGLSELIGEFKPQYEKNSNKLKPQQCWGSTGLCWCAYDSSIPPFPATSQIYVNCPTEEQANTDRPNFSSMREERRLKQKKVQTAIEKVWINLKEKAKHTLQWFKGFTPLFN